MTKKRYVWKKQVRRKSKPDKPNLPYELGREIGVDFPRLDDWEKRFNLSRPRKP